MKTSFLLFVLLLASGGGLVACGGVPSSLTICKHSCDKQGDCVKATQSEIDACKAQCDANKGTLSDQDRLVEDRCSDSAGVHKDVDDCFKDYCDQSLALACANSKLAPCGLSF